MNEIIVSLDGIDNALDIARILHEKVWGYKVNDLLLRHGCSIIKCLKNYGNVFADPKLYDTPNTVYNSVKHLVNSGADFITCHVSGGVKMLQAANQAAGNAKILGVTMLTSLEFDDIRQTYRGYPLERFSDIVNLSKIPGVVCAGADVPFWTLFDLIKVVPGVRPTGPVVGDDQVRSCKYTRADYLVIGRPIVQAKDPLAAVEEIKALCYSESSLQSALNEIRM